MKILGILGGTTRYKQIFTVYSVNGLSPTITTAASHGNGMPYILVKENKDEKDLECSNSRAAGKNNRTTEQQNNRTTEQQNNRTTEQQNNRTTEQQIELGSDKISYCLTTVQKDSLLLIKEKQIENI